MAKQYVRLADVRPPSAQDDQQTTAQLTQNSYDADSAEAFLQTVLSQIRIVTGQAKWQDPPVANLAAVTTVQNVNTQVLQAITPMVQTTATATVDQSVAIQALEQAVNSGQNQIETLTNTVAALQQMVAAQASLAQAQQDIATLRDSLNNQLLIVNTTISALQAQIASDASQDAELEAEVASLTSAVQAIKNTLYDQPLAGAQNGSNLSFTTMRPFVPGTLRLFYNGVRQHIGPGNDFIVSAGGSTIGYTQITLLARQVAPRAVDTLTVDFIPAN